MVIFLAVTFITHIIVHKRKLHLNHSGPVDTEMGVVVVGKVS